MAGVTVSTSTELLRAFERDGYAFVQRRAMQELLAPYGSLGDWAAFAESWNHLEIDTYMADGGRYRRRRHATYSAAANVACTAGD